MQINTVAELIAWLQKQDPEAKVEGAYDGSARDLVVDPETATVGVMPDGTGCV